MKTKTPAQNKLIVFAYMLILSTSIFEHIHTEYAIDTNEAAIKLLDQRISKAIEDCHRAGQTKNE